MRVVCDRANAVSHLSKKYRRACQLLRVTQYLKAPFFLPCVVEDYDDDHMLLSPVYLRHVKRLQRRITYSSLSLSDKPSVCLLCCMLCLNNAKLHCMSCSLVVGDSFTAIFATYWHMKLHRTTTSLRINCLTFVLDVWTDSFFSYISLNRL